MKYVLVSGGVISGVGKGIIGKRRAWQAGKLQRKLPTFSATASLTRYSVVYGPPAEDDWSQDMLPCRARASAATEPEC
jgi:hypothetical protein